MTNSSRPALAHPEVMAGDFGLVGEMHTGFNVPSVSSQSNQNQVTTANSTFGTIITAQRVAVPRNVQRVMENLKVLCAMNGMRYVYSWEVNDRANRRKQMVEGPTIKLANDLVRTYGNCDVDVRAFDLGEHIMFYARFTDLETGFSLTRPFQQRKSQNTGMKDADRQADIVFQIGASKAIRNVVVNALSTFSDFMVEEAKKNLVEWVEHNRDKAAAFVQKTADKHQVAMIRIEAVIGRKISDWTTRDLARVMMELRAIDEGMAVADEIFPDPKDAAEVMKEKKAKKDEAKGGRSQADASTQDSGKDQQQTAQQQAQHKPEPEPQPDPEPEPSKQGQTAGGGVENLFPED